MELGYHLSAHQCQRDLDLPIVGYRRVEPQGRGLGCCGARRPGHCSRSGLPGLPAQVDKQSRQQQLVLHADRQPLAAGLSKSCVLPRWRCVWRGWAYCERSQGPRFRTTTLLRTIPHGKVPAHLPEQSNQQQRPCWPMGRRVRRLVQPPAQWDQICDASTAPLRSSRWNLPTP